MSQVSRKSGRISKHAAVQAYAPLKQNVPTVDRCTPPPAVYALRQWSIRKHGACFQIVDTVAHASGTTDWTGRYKSLQAATSGIARKLAEEFTARHQRRCRFYGIED